jgi:hypothetical protein
MVVFSVKFGISIFSSKLDECGSGENVEVHSSLRNGKLKIEKFVQIDCINSGYNVYLFMKIICFDSFLLYVNAI